eukprot:scaffold662772_cov45-Prasinocladus_malaysianus.AAC.1
MKDELICERTIGLHWWVTNRGPPATALRTARKREQAKRSEVRRFFFAQLPKLMSVFTKRKSVPQQGLLLTPSFFRCKSWCESWYEYSQLSDTWAERLDGGGRWQG